MLEIKSVNYTDDNLRKNFDNIYLMHYSRLYRFAKAYVLRDEDAENIVQDVFLLLWEKRELLDIRVSLVSYLFTLVKNKSLDYLRRMAIIEEYKEELTLKLVALEQLDYTFSSEEEFDKILTQAINNLPERCRDIFLKSRLEGKKYKEIAEELSLSVNTVENQMGIALKKLRKELKDYLPMLIFILMC